jgi:RNA polymerase-binding transcription factor DksA
VDPKRATKFKGHLLGLLARIDGDLDMTSEISHQASGGQGTGELSNVPFHLGDMGTEEFLFQLNSALMNNQSHLREEVIDALRRLDEGQYGICEGCGRSIPEERLEILPFTAVCVDCASTEADPSLNLNYGRPRVPKDTIAPEGEMGESRWPGNATDEHVPVSDDSRRRKGDRREADTHAAGTPGGGDASGGLAGSNVGRGEPMIADLEDSMGNGNFDADDETERERPTPQAGRSGGARGGTPANSREAEE